MTKVVTLVKGLTFHYQSNKFTQGVPKTVDNVLAGYLEGTGKFEIKDAENTKKVKIRKPDTKKESSEESSEKGTNEKLDFMKFRSKEEVHEYAESIGLDLGENYQEEKLKDLKLAVSTFLQKKEAEELAAEPVIEV